MAMSQNFTINPVYKWCGSVLRSIITNFITALLCCTFFWSTCATSAEKTIAVVTVLNVPPEERLYYLDTLNKFARNAVTQFLAGLRLTTEQIKSEIEAVDAQSLSKKCLDQNTLLNIYQSLRAECKTLDEFDSISSLILPKFYAQGTKVMTDFFPYGLNRLDSDDAASTSVLQFVDDYPKLPDREKFDTLIVLGFLNSYWDRVKDKPTLSETELSILYTGFGQYAVRLRRLCPTFDRNEQSICRKIADEASQRSLQAKNRQP
jgi:hypothetical protein